ncbi:Mov34/MPN/PAD-1 family protein [Pseudomonas asiatica]|uniref:Mov34/MPN/PAD-1 family protein n=1 Tax=Pseudomonas asiatica TaxID=2219225 RepID=UPI003839F407
MIFTAPELQGLYVLVESNVLDVICAYRQDSQKKHEAGGTLMGYRSGQHLHVLRATVPMPLDRRSRISFERLDPGHQLAVTKAWEESQGRIDYLGDWHTHPQLNPLPSGIDYTEWAKLGSTLDKPLLFMIVGERSKIFAAYHVDQKAISLTGGK